MPQGIPIDVELMRRARVKSGLSLRMLAERIGRRPGTVGDIEAGRSRPSDQTLHRLAAALHLSPGDLVEFEEAS